MRGWIVPLSIPEVREREQMFRTDTHNNPTAFITDIAKEAGLTAGVDYETGDSFPGEHGTYYTARLLGNPISLTIRVIDAIGFYNRVGSQRWSYIGMPAAVWLSLSLDFKTAVIGGMYNREGGAAMLSLFPKRFLF
jgi:hypothetical protein